MIRNLVKELRIFERNKVPEEIKILGIAIYFKHHPLGEQPESYLNFIPFHITLSEDG